MARTSSYRMEDVDYNHRQDHGSTTQDRCMSLSYGGSTRPSGRISCPLPRQSSQTGSSEQDDENKTHARRRVGVACARCRKRKIRCSGDPGNGDPCTNCKTAGLEKGLCQFLRVQSEVRHIVQPEYPPTGRFNEQQQGMVGSYHYSEPTPGVMTTTLSHGNMVGIYPTSSGTTPCSFGSVAPVSQAYYNRMQSSHGLAPTHYTMMPTKQPYGSSYSAGYVEETQDNFTAIQSQYAVSPAESIQNTPYAANDSMRNWQSVGQGSKAGTGVYIEEESPSYSTRQLPHATTPSSRSSLPISTESSSTWMGMDSLSSSLPTTGDRVLPPPAQLQSNHGHLGEPQPNSSTAGSQDLNYKADPAHWGMTVARPESGHRRSMSSASANTVNASNSSAAPISSSGGHVAQSYVAISPKPRIDNQPSHSLNGTLSSAPVSSAAGTYPSYSTAAARPSLNTSSSGDCYSYSGQATYRSRSDASPAGRGPGTEATLVSGHRYEHLQQVQPKHSKPPLKKLGSIEARRTLA